MTAYIAAKLDKLSAEANTYDACKEALKEAAQLAMENNNEYLSDRIEAIRLDVEEMISEISEAIRETEHEIASRR